MSNLAEKLLDASEQLQWKWLMGNARHIAQHNAFVLARALIEGEYHAEVFTLEQP